MKGKAQQYLTSALSVGKATTGCSVTKTPPIYKGTYIEYGMLLVAPEAIYLFVQKP